MDPWSHPLTLEAWSRLAAILPLNDLDASRVEAAARYAAGAHAGQLRRSGAPYITHPIEVAALVADAGGTTAMVEAALLHDVVEDTAADLADIRSHFGDEVASLVDGCTKVSVVHPGAGEAAQQAARLRKLFVALARDPRVVVVKLCDRLHNLRTIGYLAPAKAARIGAETLAVHAPLAHRLGLGAMKAELEDRAFAVADPEGYAAVEGQLAAMPGLHDRLAAARDELAAFVADVAPSAVVSGRIKHRWSIHRKCRRLGCGPGDLNDLLGLRVVVATLEECYAVLAEVHRRWSPLPGRFKDYVQRPKFNGYQSLHTTLERADGSRLEVQVRTADMHAAAERGAASHHLYKNPGEEPLWLARLLEWAGSSVDDDDEYVEGVRAELDARSEVLVFTPGGDVVALPFGATVVDFAFAVHTELGNRCVGVKVDGRLVPLSTRLQTGARVEVLTGEREGPSLEWLDWVVTSKARSRIRQFHAQRLKSRARETGRERLLRAARDLRLRAGDEAQVMADAFAASGTSSPEEMLEMLGSGRLDPVKLLRPPVPRPRPAPAPLPAGVPVVPAAAGLAGVEVRRAGCCEPSERDRLRGVVSRGGVVVHAAGCPAVASLLDKDPGREVPVFWVRDGLVVETVHLAAALRSGLLFDLGAQLSSAGAELLSSSSSSPGTGDVSLVVAVAPGRLGALRSALGLVAGVTSVR